MYIVVGGAILVTADLLYRSVTSKLKLTPALAPSTAPPVPLLPSTPLTPKSVNPNTSMTLVNSTIVKDLGNSLFDSGLVAIVAAGARHFSKIWSQKTGSKSLN